MYKKWFFWVLGVLMLFVAGTSFAKAQILSTTLSEADRTSLTYTEVTRDTLNIRCNLYNDVQAYQSELIKAWNNLMAKKSTGLPPELDEAFMEDLFRYTDAHLPEDIDNTARQQATDSYNKGLNSIKSAPFDTLFDRYATTEIRVKYRDIILNEIRDARKKIEGLQNYDDATRELGMNGIFNEFWNTEKAVKLKNSPKYYEPLRQEVLEAYEASREDYIEAEYQRNIETLRHSSMAHRGFKPVISEFSDLCKDLRNLYNEPNKGYLFEQKFGELWVPWIKKTFPSYVALKPLPEIVELTQSETLPNPYYDPDYANRVAVWDWLDDITTMGYEQRGDYRYYNGHENNRVRVTSSGGALVYNGSQLVAVTKDVEPLSEWGVICELAYQDFLLGRYNVRLESADAQNDIAFHLSHHLPPVSDFPFTASYIEKLAKDHLTTMADYTTIRDSGLSFLHQSKNKKIIIRETYAEMPNGTLYRTYSVEKYEPDWQ